MDGVGLLPETAMDIKDAIALYLQSLRATGYASFTTASISSCLGLFARYVGDTDIEGAAECVTAFLAQRSQKVKRNTLAANFSHLKQFLRFSVRQGWLSKNPLQDMRSPKQEVVVTAPLSDNDIIGLLNAARQWQRAAIILLLGSGMRIGELAALRWQDVGEGVLLLHGKGSKQRMVAPGAMAMRELVRLPKVTERVFPCTYGSMKVELRRLSHDTGIRFSPHVFRHTFANRFLRAGGSIEELNTLLGHARLDTTAIYVRAFRRERALEAMQLYNPADILLDKTLRAANLR